MRELTLKAFKAQKTRGQKRLNGKLKEEEIDLFCKISGDAFSILESAMSRFALSHRSIASIKKVARTIADINGNDDISRMDILEALSYRKRKIIN
jgi:magnesium chelatase family protein